MFRYPRFFFPRAVLNFASQTQYSSFIFYASTFLQEYTITATMVEKLYVTYNQVSTHKNVLQRKHACCITDDFTACVRPETTEMDLCALL